MNVTMMSRTAVMAALLGLPPVLAAQQPPAPAGGAKPDQVAALKQSLAEGTKKLAQYEWVETTVISMKGEEKSRRQNRCYYGADGKVQKVAMGGEPKPEASGGGGGGRGRKKGGGAVKGAIVENKKEDIQDYMEQAAALIDSYVPPQPDKVQAVKEGGRVAAKPQAGGSVRIEMTQDPEAGRRAVHRPRSRRQPAAGPQCQQLRRDARRTSDPRRADGDLARRRAVRRQDDARCQGEEHPGGDHELRAQAAGEVTPQPGPETRGPRRPMQVKRRGIAMKPRPVRSPAAARVVTIHARPRTAPARPALGLVRRADGAEKRHSVRRDDRTVGDGPTPAAASPQSARAL